MEHRSGKILINPGEVGRLERFRSLGISVGSAVGLPHDVWEEAGAHEATHLLARDHLTDEQQVEALRAGARAAGLPVPDDNERMFLSYGWSTQIEQESQMDYERGTGVLSGALSNYGSFGNHEALAEALTEYTLSPRPRPFAKAVGDHVLNVLREVRT